MKIFRTSSYSPQMTVGLGVAVAGLSQAILFFAPSSTLPESQLVDLALWISISGGIGILVSSIVSNSLFYRIVRAHSRSSDVDDTHETTISLFVFTASICLILYFVRDIFFTQDKETLGILLTLSILLQFVASVQRSYYSGNGQWIPLSGQMAIDGILRVGLTVSLISFGNLSLITLLILSVLSQVCGIVFVTAYASWGKGFTLSMPNLSKAAVESSLLLISAGGSLVFTTFTPVILKLFNSSPEVVSVMAAALIVSRIPSSVLLPISIPTLRDQASLAHKGETLKRSLLIRNTSLRLSGYSIILAMFIQFVIHALPISVLDLSILSDSSFITSALLILMSLTFVQEGFRATIINSLGNFSVVALIYASIIPIFVWLLSENGESINFALLATAVGSLSVALLSRFYANRLVK